MTQIQTPSVALIGCGQWGKNIARNLAELGALRIICDADAARGATMAKELGVEFQSDLDGTLARRDLAAVAIATPAVTHAEIAGRAIDAGKHVFVEKPIALAVLDAHAISTRAKAKHLTLMTGHLLQYHPVFVRLLALVRAGKVGRLQYIYSNRLNQGRVRTEENALWSLAPHDISMILALAGSKPRQLMASGQVAIQTGIPDVVIAHLEFDGSLKAHLFSSWLNPYKEHILTVIGDKAMIVFNDTVANWEEKLILYPHHVEWKQQAPEFVKGAPEPIIVERGEPLRNEMEHFLACVDGKAVSRTGPEEAIPVLEVLAAAQRAMDTAACINL